STEFFIVGRVVVKLPHIEVRVQLPIDSREQIEIERRGNANRIVISRQEDFWRLFEIGPEQQRIAGVKQPAHRSQELSQFIAAEVAEVRSQEQCDGSPFRIGRHRSCQRFKRCKIIGRESRYAKPRVKPQQSLARKLEARFRNVYGKVMKL